MHIKTKTQPQFENIRNTFTRVHEEIQDQIDVISKDKDRLVMPLLCREVYWPLLKTKKSTSKVYCKKLRMTAFSW
jgi:hypothetical protein